MLPDGAKELLEVAAEIVRVKERAGRVGLYATMQALEQAQTRVGFEIEEWVKRRKAS